jgi:hypothetical protein
LSVSGGALDLTWAYHVGDDSKLVFAEFNLSPDDITWMSLYLCSFVALFFRLLPVTSPVLSEKQKTLLAFP